MHWSVKVCTTLIVVLQLVCADWTSVINTYSSVCQWSINTSAPALYTADCNTLTATQATYITVVKSGFCTEREFNNLTATVCGSSYSTKSDSAAKLNFYNVLNNISRSCKQTLWQCLSRSLSAIVFKQQEMFCGLFITPQSTYSWNTYNYFTTEECSSSSCTTEEYLSLKTAACNGSTTDVDQKFSTVLIRVSSMCQNKMYTCSNLQSLQSVKAMQYCEYFKISTANYTTKSCLKSGNACTLSELVELQDAACGAKTSVISTYSSACRVTMRLMAPRIYTADCNSVTISQENYLNLVKLGFCTEREFQNLTSTACGSSSSTKSDSAAKLNFYRALNQTSEKCQQQCLTCFSKSFNTIVLKQQEQYCSLMNLELDSESTEDCLAFDCTNEEFSSLQTAACSVSKTDVDQTFSKAILRTWSTCQNRMYLCNTYDDSRAKNNALKMQYCVALSVGRFFNCCLDYYGQCMLSELTQLKDAACGTAEALTSTNVLTAQDESSVILADSSGAPGITTTAFGSSHSTAGIGATNSAVGAKGFETAKETSSGALVTTFSLGSFVVLIGHIAVNFC